MIEKLGQLWTNAIAYVALAIGAGLSIMYNVVDTVEQRGANLDRWDIVTAVAAPAIVLLMVEMFVSKRWATGWQSQTIRWVATLAIGGVAMATSWTHGHDFMLGHGQTAMVATAWPVAIDLLAIMATGLILSGRRGHMAKLATVGQRLANALDVMATGQPEAASGQWTGPVATEEDVAISEAAFRGQDYHANWPERAMTTEEIKGTFDRVDEAHGKPVWPWDAATPDDPEVAMTLAQWASNEKAVAKVGDEAEAYANSGASTKVTPPPVVLGIPYEARRLLVYWLESGEDGPDSKQVDEAMAAYFGKSLRTVRRWRSIVSGRPTSGA